MKSHIQQYFSYIVVVSFIDGGNQCNREKRSTSNEVTDNLSRKVVLSTPRHRGNQTLLLKR